MKDDKTEIESLILTMSKGPLSEADRQRLNELLRRSPEALDTWLDHAEMTTWLGSMGLESASASPVASIEPTPTSTRQPILAIAAAITICAGLLIWLLAAKPEASKDLVTEADSDTKATPTDRQGEYEKIVATLPVTGSQTRPPTGFENVAAASHLPEQIDFNRDIRPILTENCIACHGPDEHDRAAGLRLDTYAGATAGELPAIVPGDVEASESYHRIHSDDADDIMPPPKSNKSLTDRQKALLALWIEQGAEYQKHWSLVPPQQSISEDSEHARHPIDVLVQRQLDTEGLSLSPEAPGYTLLRRATLDLTGLPPTLEEIADFSPDGYEATLDRLLASPAYGEHRARYWLDAARYGDTHGLHLDNYREIWPYRDWVIQAYNDNLPFDQFTIEQLAGDLLPEPTQSQRVATGFNRCNVTTAEGGAIAEEFLTRYAVDRVNTTATVWLGMTAGCAQCHDHKFDPLTMREFYQLYAFFNHTTQPAMDGNNKDSPPVIHVYPDEATEARAKALQTEIRSTEKALAAAKKQAEASYQAWLADVSPKKIDAAIASLDPLPLTTTGDQISGLPDFAKTDPFTLSMSYQLPDSGDAIILDKTDPALADRGIRLRVEKARLIVELIESWPNRMLRIGASSAFKPGARGRIVVSYDGSGSSAGLSLWVNGRAQTSRFLNSWAETLVDDFTTDAPARLGEAGVAPVTIYAAQLPTEVINSLTVHQASRGAARKAADKRTKQETDRLRALYDSCVDADVMAQIQQLHSHRAALQRIHHTAPITLVMHEKPGAPTAHILERGEYDQKGESVSPGFPAYIEMPSSDLDAFPKNRLGLAQWLVDPSHPLTARVTVNRVWQELFGRGLVKTSEDFGTQGEAPSHPELLDHLALYFVESGWDLKQLYRHIMTSAVYRQSSHGSPELIARDPENILLARGPRFRLDAETIRDQALAASGLLDRRIGGPSVKPYQPDGIWKTVGYTNSNTQTFQQDYGHSPEHRRSVYSFWKRTAPPPNMAIFDAPDRESCTVRRERTNTPLQALVLMNDPQYMRTARHLAQRIIAEASATDSERIDQLALLTLSRQLSPDESQVVANSLTQFRDIYRSQSEAARELLHDPANATFSLQTEDPNELASWIMVASQIMNLDETVTKN